jgi:hypothetical protein
MDYKKMLSKPIITCKDLLDLGLPDRQVKRVIHDAKKDAVLAGFEFYRGKQNFAPTKFVCQIMGFEKVA